MLFPSSGILGILTLYWNRGENRSLSNQQRCFSLCCFPFMSYRQVRFRFPFVLTGSAVSRLIIQFQFTDSWQFGDEPLTFLWYPVDENRKAPKTAAAFCKRRSHRSTLVRFSKESAPAPFRICSQFSKNAASAAQKNGGSDDAQKAIHAAMRQALSPIRENGLLLFFGALAQLSHPLLRSSAHLFRLWQKAVLSHNNEQ